ncbi:MAG: ATPase, partial [Anaerolineae bacterium]
MRQELDIYIRARYPLLYVVTAEEERALAEIQKLADESKTRKQVIAWSCTEGFVNQASGRKDPAKRDPLVALNSIMEDNTPTLVILRDFHPFFENHEIVRKLRDLAQALQKGHRTVILLSPVLRIPPELEKEITVI